LRALDAAAGPQVHEVDAPLLEPTVATDRVAPVRVAAVDEDVALVELLGEIV
jgi:hypothetical protein